jgi:hypothetical protein
MTVIDLVVAISQSLKWIWYCDIAVIALLAIAVAYLRSINKKLD